MKLASEGAGRAVWNCPSCRIKKEQQIKITWSRLVCVECTHKLGKECLIQSCASDCLTKQALTKKKEMVAPPRAKPLLPIAVRSSESKNPPIGHFFKYNKKYYQNVTKFCDNHDGLKKASSSARKAVVNTDFPKSAYLVIPGHSNNNYRWMPENWKNGITDLSNEPAAAHFLEQGGELPDAHILLVSHEELKRAAAKALSDYPQRKRKGNPDIEKTQRAHKRQAKEKPQDHVVQQNIFPTEQVGICPHCHKAADVSKFTVDPRNRCRCPQQDCRSQEKFLHWHCVKCSNKGRPLPKVTYGHANHSKDYAIQ